MNYVPRRTLVVWTALVIATCATWAIGVSHFFPVEMAAIMVLILAFIKIRFVGSDIMELRHAPSYLLRCYDAYAVAVVVVLAMWYLAG